MITSLSGLHPPVALVLNKTARGLGGLFCGGKKLLIRLGRPVVLLEPQFEVGALSGRPGLPLGRGMAFAPFSAPLGF